MPRPVLLKNQVRKTVILPGNLAGHLAALASAWAMTESDVIRELLRREAARGNQ